MNKNDNAFEMAAAAIRFGVGVTREVGSDLADLGARNVLVVTDPAMARLPPVQTVVESLAVTAITRDKNFIESLMESTLIDRLNIGPISTMKVSWSQPHEGNMFEFLYKRRSLELEN